MSAMINGLGGGIDQVRTKAIVDALKEHVDRRLADVPKGQIVNKTEMLFPSDELGTILSKELSAAFAKALGEVRWPQPTSNVEVKGANITVDSSAMAKAIDGIGRLVSEAPLPIMEAVDLEPLVLEIREGNEAVVSAIERFTQAMLVQGEMLKGLAQAIVSQSKASTKQGLTTLTVNHSDGTTSTIVKD